VDKLNAEVTKLAEYAGYASPHLATRMHKLVRVLVGTAQTKCLTTLPYMEQRIKDHKLDTPGANDIYMLAVADCIVAIGVLLEKDEDEQGN